MYSRYDAHLSLARCLWWRTLSQDLWVIPRNVIKLLKSTGVIYVGTCNKAGIPNISARTVFLVEKTSIVWASWFERKTFWNIKENNYATVVVVDPTTLTGYQMKGHVELIIDADQILNFMRTFMKQRRRARFKRTAQTQQHNPYLIVRFNVEELHSFDVAESANNYMPM